ncbi:MAG: hypothetical protein M0Z95_03165 [Actinomycetota bacterium]|jgi:hypothetical protein|nr:hypothetical protein [Actinomycetota bacterium]
MTSKKPLLTKPSEIVDEPWVRVEMAGLPACDFSFVGKWQVFIDRDRAGRASRSGMLPRALTKLRPSGPLGSD